MGNTWTLVLQCLKPKEILKDVGYQTRIWGDNSGTPNSVNNLMHNWASPKSFYEPIEWQTLKAQNPKTLEISELKLKWTSQTNRSMDVFGWIQTHIGNQKNVSVTTPQTERFSEEAALSQTHIRKLLLKLRPNQMFVGESKTAERLESDFNWTFIALAW